MTYEGRRRRRRGCEEGCGRQQRRSRECHRVALDGEAARANNVTAARKSRKEPLAITTTTTTTTAVAAVAHMILDDNTPGLLLDP